MSKTVICPPQKTPFNQPRGDDEPFSRTREIFDRCWWLFFHDLADLLAQGIGALLVFLTRNGIPIVFNGSQLSQDIGEFFGDHISVRILGAKGDTQVSSGSITATDNTLTLDEPLLTRGDQGKLISVAGAGVAGIPLGTTIFRVLSSTSALLGDAAATTVTSERVEWGTDDTEAINNALSLSTTLKLGLLIPWGRYTISDRLSWHDAQDVSLVGQGDGSAIVGWAGWPDSTNFLEVSGSKNLRLENLLIDGRFIVKDTLQLSAIYGDGTADNPSYGPIAMRELTIANWQNLGIAVGANDPNTASDVTIEQCIFENYGMPFYANAIDTGSSGTKYRYRIVNNRILWNPTESAGLANGIFCGHGFNYDFLIEGNQIYQAAGNGIQIFSRPFGAEATGFFGASIVDNVISLSGTSAIAIYGLQQGAISGNTLLNPGVVGVSDEDKAGILITNGDSAGTPYAPKDLSIEANTIVDNRTGSEIMSYGVFDSHAIGYGATGHYGYNVVSGAVLGEFKFTPDDDADWTYVTRQPGGKLGFGKLLPVDRMDTVGNICARLPSNENVFLSTSIEPAAADVGSPFLYGYGTARYDATADEWQTVFDGAVNGFSEILFSSVDGALRFVLEDSSGGGQRTYSPAAFGALVRLIMSGTANGTRFDGRVGFGEDASATQDVIANTIEATSHFKASYASASRPAIINGAQEITDLGANGISGNQTVVDSITVSTNTFGYQSGASSVTVVSGVSFTTATLGFTLGSRTA